MPSPVTDIVRRHLERVCVDAGAISATIVLIGAGGDWLESEQYGDRDPDYDRAVIELRNACDVDSLTVQYESHGEMVEARSLPNERKIILIATIDRRSPEAARQSGYVRHEVRRKLRQLVRALS